ncbi:MAG TPA: FAD-binding oxidoreductase [Alphaproteobacteria bacterium]|nr:FAD-binding oxidoreductase [Alphaproteobacteria bacterium]
MTAVAKLVPADALAAIKAAVGAKGWIDDPAEMERYLLDERRLYRGRTPLIVRPATTAEVAAVVGICARHRIPVVPQGGNTGLVGGSVPHEHGGEILLSLARMSRIRAIDPLNYTMTAEAGCILANLQKAAEDADRLFPLSLAAEGSCMIGGNLSTNAGGVAVLRYGNARELVLGLEVVLPDGRIWDGLTALRKDNTGYDLKQLFVGGEGTLGVITAAVLKLFPRPRQTVTAFVAVPTPHAALELLARAREGSGDQLSAFELMPRFAVDIVLRHIAGNNDPLAKRYEHYVLLEFTTADAAGNLAERVENLLGAAMEAGLVQDATIAANEAQAKALWRIRESIPEAQKFEGGGIKHDVAVPVSRVADFIMEAKAACEAHEPKARVLAFGHLGDGNVHFNLCPPLESDPAAFQSRWEEFNHIVHEIVVGMGGSISAEHGIGRLKRGEFHHYAPAVELDMMRAVKRALDPHNLMNPGKVI